LQLQGYKEKRANMKAKQEQLTAIKLTIATLQAQKQRDQHAGERQMLPWTALQHTDQLACDLLTPPPDAQ